MLLKKSQFYFLGHPYHGNFIFPSQTVKQFSEERAILIYFLSVLCMFEKFLKTFEIRIQYQEAVQGGS